MVPKLSRVSGLRDSQDWRVEVRTGSVESGHEPTGPFDCRLVLRHEPTGPALVLGSGQRMQPGLESRAEAEGLPVIRRRSGGGAVLVIPEAVLWVDLLLPRVDSLWEEDVGRSTAWVGMAWQEALSSFGIQAHLAGRNASHGSSFRGSLGHEVCFAGRTASEVLVGKRKVVGISQRRDRHGARFQCAALVGSNAVELSVAPLVRLLGFEPADKALEAILDSVGSVNVTAGDLFLALLGALKRVI